MDIRVCKIFLASPTETDAERKAVREIISDVEDMLGENLGITLKLLTWEDSTYPSIGDYSQAVIDSQIGDDYDIFVGIMWKKFGTPTKVAGSGTEEEYNRALDNYTNGVCKNIMFYFNQAPLPQDSDFAQFAKVQEFKNKVGETDGVYYWGYCGLEEFKKLFRKHLCKCLNNLYKTQPEMQSTDSQRSSSDFTETLLGERMLDYLNEMGTTFTHPNVDIIAFDDLFVAQQLKRVRSNGLNISSSILTDAVDVDGIRYFISGHSTSGKSSLAKFMFKRYFYEHNMIPILLDGMDFNQNLRADHLASTIQKKLSEQYESLSCSFCQDDDNCQFVLIIDDFQKATKGNPRYWSVFIRNLESIAKHIIVFADTQIGLTDLSRNPPFENFERFEIMPFGTKLRSELINRWYKLGFDSSDSDAANNLLRKCDEAKDMVKKILGRNYIPSYPFYVLGMLQTFEVFSQNAANYSLYGFYYENLINDSLNKAASDRKNLSYFYGFLTEYCYYLFEFMHENRSTDNSGFEEFYNGYCERHAIDRNKITYHYTKKTLEEANIITKGINIRIAQSYIYYFFTAKFLANNIEKEETKEILLKIMKRAFRSEYASILMYVTHLSKNTWIINSLIKCAENIFGDVEPSRLEDDLDNINNLINEVPKKIVGLIDVASEREQQLAFEEEREEQERDFYNDTLNYQELSIDDDISGIDIIARFNLAMKTVDLLGEIAKKYWGDLLADEKHQLVLSAYNLGLRTLHVYLNMMDDTKEELINYIKFQIAEKYVNDKMKQWNADLNKDVVKKMSDGLLFQLAFFATWSFIRRISCAVGYDKLNLTYEKILEENSSNSFKLIDLSIDLNYPDLDVSVIEGYAKQMRKNHMCFTVLRELTANHLLMFDESYRKKDKLFQLLDIDDKKQKELIGSKIEKRN